jgi:hypothetical protein
MAKLEKEDLYIEIYMGTHYVIPKVENIGELKSFLEQIVADLPNDDSLKIGDFGYQDGKLYYILVDGISQ